MKNRVSITFLAAGVLSVAAGILWFCGNDTAMGALWLSIGVLDFMATGLVAVTMKKVESTISDLEKEAEEAEDLASEPAENGEESTNVPDKETAEQPAEKPSHEPADE